MIFNERREIKIRTFIEICRTCLDDIFLLRLNLVYRFLCDGSIDDTINLLVVEILGLSFGLTKHTIHSERNRLEHRFRIHSIHFHTRSSATTIHHSIQKQFLLSTLYDTFLHGTCVRARELSFSLRTEVLYTIFSARTHHVPELTRRYT